MTANKIKRSLKGDKLNFENIRKVLYSLGYSVVFFNTFAGDLEIERYNLTEEKNRLEAFSYSENARIVFISDTVSAEDKMYYALHELGHIALGHLDKDVSERSKVLMDIEAYGFAHSIVYKKNRSYLYILASAIILSISIIAGAFIKSTTVPVQTTITKTIQATTEPADIITEAPETITDKVYVTPSGKKYHRGDCYHIRDKATVIELHITEAEKKYLPCSVCNSK